MLAIRLMRIAPWVAILMLVAVEWRRPGTIHARRLERDREFSEGARLKPNLEHSAELYQTCAACHGPDGRGTADGEIPAIAGQRGSMLLGQLTDFATTSAGTSACGISPIAITGGAQDLTDVAAYVAGLPRFPATAKGIGDGTALGAGASTYFRKCERCLGPLGQGDLLRRRPRLAGQRSLLWPASGNSGQPASRDGSRAHRHAAGHFAGGMRGVADYLSRVSPDLSSIEGR